MKTYINFGIIVLLPIFQTATVWEITSNKEHASALPLICHSQNICSGGEYLAQSLV